MNSQQLIDIARSLVGTGKGLLAIDESNATCDKRFAKRAMHVKAKTGTSPLPWALTFSFGRAIQQPALRIWSGEETHRGAAQAALLHRAQCNRAARRGEYEVSMELP
jgi:fructose-bisphosphate aldolase class 1